MSAAIAARFAGALAHAELSASAEMSTCEILEARAACARESMQYVSLRRFGGMRDVGTAVA